MTSQSASAGLPPALSLLQPGAPVGNRFTVLELADQSPLGPVYLCQDIKTNRHVRVHLVASLPGDAQRALRQQVKRSMAIRHRNLLSTYGVGTHEDSCNYVVEELSAGMTLSQFVAERQQRGEVGSLRAAFNIVAHVAKALSAVHETTFHGAVRPDVVHISTTGRVRLAELAISQQLVDTSWPDRVEASQRTYLAPEIARGLQPDIAADIYGLGGLLQYLLTEQSPGRHSRPPSAARPDTSPAVDTLLARCFATDPHARFDSTADFMADLLELVTAAPDDAPEDAGLDMDLEIDVDVAASIPPPATTAAVGSTAAHATATSSSAGRLPLASPATPLAANTDTQGTEQRARSSGPPANAPGRRLSPHPLPFAPAPAAIPTAVATPPTPSPLPSPLATPKAGVARGPMQGPAPGGPLAAGPPLAAASPPAHPGDHTAAGSPPRPGSSPDNLLKAQLEELTQNDSPRWMATKDGMDHGPFTSRELVKQIVDGEILPEHMVGDMHGGERKSVAEFPEFQDFVAQYQLRKAEADHQQALEKTSKAEKRSNITKSLVLAGSLLAILAAGGTYFASREAADTSDDQGDVDLAAMYQGDEVKIEGTADVLKKKRRRRNGAAARKESGENGSKQQGGFGSYEDAMNQAVELGDATRGGGERQLRREDVAAVMNRHLNSMFSCVSQERGRGGKLGNVRIDIAIRGSGNVMGASVRAGSPTFRKCIVGKVRNIHFPQFPAPRMGATYSFSAD